MNKIFIGILTMLLLPSLIFAHSEAHLGDIQFPSTGKREAQPYFEKGVMLLHSFQYDEARSLFQKAQKLDPDFALAYWGEAMTYNHPLWHEQECDKAVKALARFASTAEERVSKAKSGKEKGFMNAINHLYGKGDKITRDKNYMNAMRQLYSQYPEDNEIAIFYSLALLGTAETDRDTRTYMRAAGVAEDIYERNKLHPGALHYVIHAYDDPIHAPLGLRAARAYAKVAPNASHALHMPSHIFTALGLWDDVIHSNQAAWQVGVAQNKNNKPAAYTIHDLHALQWLAYGHLQKKHYSQALKLTQMMENIALKTNSPMAKWYYAHMRATYIVESKNYFAPLKSIAMKNVELSAYASNVYADALIAKQQCSIKRMEQLLDELINATPNQLSKKTYSNYFTSVTKIGITTAQLVALEIKADIADCQHQPQQAIQYLQQATKLEAQLSFGYGPPIPVKPSFELLAEMFLNEKQYTKAYQQYVISLKRMPNRLLSVEGLEQAKMGLLKQHLDLPSEDVQPYFHRLILPEYYH